MSDLITFHLPSKFSTVSLERLPELKDMSLNARKAQNASWDRNDNPFREGEINVAKQAGQHHGRKGDLKSSVPARRTRVPPAEPDKPPIWPRWRLREGGADSVRQSEKRFRGFFSNTKGGDTERSLTTRCTAAPCSPEILNPTKRRENPFSVLTFGPGSEMPWLPKSPG